MNAAPDPTTSPAALSAADLIAAAAALVATTYRYRRWIPATTAIPSRAQLDLVHVGGDRERA